MSGSPRPGRPARSSTPEARLLVVDDDPAMVMFLQGLLERAGYARVLSTTDPREASALFDVIRPDLVLLDLHLAHGTTGFPVAVRLNDLGVPCLFVSGKAPRFPMPDLALGCLMKPFTAEDVHRSLAMAEDMLRGRETLRPKIPENLTIYEQLDDAPLSEEGFIPSKPSLRTRFEHWISGHQH